MTTTRRIGPGEYVVSDDGASVSISRYYWLPRSSGQWVARADWDKHTVTDPLFTKADAVTQAGLMLSDYTAEVH